MFSFYRKWKRKSLGKRSFPTIWVTHLERNVPFYSRLNEGEKEKLRRDLKVFLWEKHFIAAGGMELNEEVKVVISAAAVHLILYLDLSFYDRLTEIVVYPGDYKHPGKSGRILGEAHDWGVVVLSWDAVRSGLYAPTDGSNTAFHEFAHVLDRADGSFDGTPLLHAHEHYRPWANIMDHHYQKLRKGNRRQRKALDDYGATNEAEFFAVATEVFFENPKLLAKKTPDLYRQLSQFYRYDPSSQ